MTPNTLPESPEDITPEWLNQALAEHFPGVKVSAVSAEPAKHATNSNSVIHLDYESRAGAPDSMFLKLPPQHGDPRRELVNQSGMGRREALFYRDLASKVDMRIPECYVAQYRQEDSTFVLLIEDLNASACYFPEVTAGFSPEHVMRAMLQLANLHVTFEDSAVREKDAPWVQPPKRWRDYAVAMLQYGLDNNRDKLTEEFAEISELYINYQEQIHDAWELERSTLIHGDTHCGNLFADGDEPGFLDWGLINLNHPMRDVSYYICMALSPDNRKQHEKALIEHYLRARDNCGGDSISFDEAWQAHRLHAAYTVVASCQVVMFADDISPEREVFANAFIGRSFAAIRDLDSAALVREKIGL